MRKLACVVVAMITLMGCQTNQQTGELIGGLGGAGLGGAIGSRFGGTTGGLIGAGLGGLGGALIGGAIGRSLDERDQQRVALATQQVLAEPTPAAAYEQPYDNQGASSPAPRRTASRPRPAATRAATRTWTSDHSGAHGSATVVSATPASSSSGECKVVHQTAYVSGKEVSQDQRYCVGSNNEWQKA